ncbi:hypothetical protein [Nocardioides malaquae]|nr:hypothetical protein [Nocardioides malaquae]
MARLSSTQVEDLLREFEVYDQHVDVVSAIQSLLTVSTELRPTVQHFERFPVIPQDGKPSLTPDFTVLYTDGTALIGEVASVARHDGSITKIVNQLANYDTITAVPAGPSRRSVAPIQTPDVLLIVPISRGQRAFFRIEERLKDGTYAPSKRPVIAQYAKGDSEYTIQRLLHADNGTLDPGSRAHHLGHVLDEDLTVPARLFSQSKIAHRFINDVPSTLYLATHLLMHYLPSVHPVGEQAAVVPADVAEVLRRQYGGGIRASNIRQALDLIQKAGYARCNPDKTWDVSLRQMKSKTETDVHRIILSRASKTTSSVLPPRERPAPSVEQLALFHI